MMKNRVLFVSHTANFSKFNRPYMRWFKDNGFIVDYASAGEEKVLDCDNHYTIPFNRFPFSTKNISAYKKLKKIIDEGDYCLVHCHTPVGGVIARLACRKARKNGLKVIYTAHGFHFYKGCPKKNWLIYYPVEKLLSKYTDAIVTINTEDYNNVILHKFKANDIYRIDGVGVDLSCFKPVNTYEKSNLRVKYGYDEKDFILINVAELNANKSQGFLIEQVSKLKREIPMVKLLLVGSGDYEDKYRKLAKELDVLENVHFLGYRNDVGSLYALADICVSASAREGLPINIMEAMSCGLPIVCSKNRGHIELVENGQNGFIYNWSDSEQFNKQILYLYNDTSLREKIRKNNLSSVGKYSLDNAINSMSKIYQNTLPDVIKEYDEKRKYNV